MTKNLRKLIKAVMLLLQDWHQQTEAKQRIKQVETVFYAINIKTQYMNFAKYSVVHH